MITWPGIFGDQTHRYSGETERASACADGLGAWALCMSGNKPPDWFGTSMVEIGRVLGVSPTPDNLMKISEEFVV